MKNLFVVLSLVLGSLATTGCLETHVRDYGDTMEVTDLDSAREAWVKSMGKSAVPFYAKFLADNPRNPEALFFAAGAKDAFEKPENPEFGNPEQGGVLRYLSQAQKALKIPAKFYGKILTDHLRVATDEDLAFAPYELGMDGERVFFDPATYRNVLAQAEAANFLFGLGRAINLKVAAALDGYLTGVVTTVFARSDCKAGVSQRIRCANEVMAQALAVFNNSDHKQFGNLFTVSPKDGKKLVSGLDRSIDAIKKLVAAMDARPALAENQSYLQRSLSADDREFMPCALGPCAIPVTKTVSIRLDVPGFLRKLLVGTPSQVKEGLRAIFPSKLAISEEQNSFADFLKGLQFKDPTLGGLFPDGDLITKIAANPESDIAMMLGMYSSFIYEWALGDERR